MHGKHPAECRAFYCKEPEALMQLSNEPRLEREKICEIINAPGYWTELIKTHEEAVGYEELGPWALKIDEDSDARQKFLEKLNSIVLSVSWSWRKKPRRKRLYLFFSGVLCCKP